MSDVLKDVVNELLLSGLSIGDIAKESKVGMGRLSEYHDSGGQLTEAERNRVSNFFGYMMFIGALDMKLWTTTKQGEVVAPSVALRR